MGGWGFRIPIRWSLVTLLGTAWWILPACDREATVEWLRDGRLNVLIVLNDTMRRDSLGIYGGAAATPHFDAFGRENLLFRRAYSQAPWTIPSMATLFTSLYPSQHGTLSHPVIRERNGDGRREAATDVLAQSHVTLAEVLREAGYATAAFVSNPWLRAEMGFAQGFDRYDDSFADDWRHDRQEEMTQAAIEWLDDRRRDRPYLLFLHYLSSHRPFEGLPREEADRIANEHPLQETGAWPAGSHRSNHYREKRMAPEHVVTLDDGRPLAEVGIVPTIHHVRRAYERGVERFDQELGRILAALARDPDQDETIVLILSDHGEALYERGPYGSHGTDLFEEQIAIPFAARFPGVSASSVDVQRVVGLIDVLPTLCRRLGIVCPTPTYGVDMLGRIRRPSVSEGVMSARRHRAIVEFPFKLVREPEPPEHVRHRRAYPEFALFDLGSDPQERRNLLQGPRSPAIEGRFRRLAAEMDRAVEAIEVAREPQVTLGEEQIEELRALGYLQ